MQDTPLFVLLIGMTLLLPGSIRAHDDERESPEGGQHHHPEDSPVMP